MFGFFRKKKTKDNKPSREEILRQAQENARKAREEIGDENIQRMAEALQKMHDPDYQSAGKQAQDEIEKMDKGHVADNLKLLLEEDK